MIVPAFNVHLANCNSLEFKEIEIKLYPFWDEFVFQADPLIPIKQDQEFCLRVCKEAIEFFQNPLNPYSSRLEGVCKWLYQYKRNDSPLFSQRERFIIEVISSFIWELSGQLRNVGGFSGIPVYLSEVIIRVSQNEVSSRELKIMTDFLRVSILTMLATSMQNYIETQHDNSQG